MRILMLGQIPKEYGGSYTTGVANVMINLAKVMESDGHSLAIFGTNYGKQKTRFSNKILFYGFDKTKLLWLLLLEFLKTPISFLKEMVAYKTKFGVNPVKHTAYRVLINHVIKDFNPHVIHMHGMLFSPFIKHLESDYNSKIVMTFHGIFHRDETSIKSNLDRGLDIVKLNNEGSKLLKHVTFLTNEMLQQGIESLSLREDCSKRVIRNGINAAFFKYSTVERDFVRNQLNIAETMTVFITVGALTKRKNHMSFINYLIRNKIFCTYLIVAKFEASETERELKKVIANSKGLVDIKIIEYVPQNLLYKYYSASDFYAHPSLSEGQALVVLEALACGLPLVVNRKIKGTIDLGTEYDRFIQTIDLSISSEQLHKFGLDRNVLALKAQKELSWDKISSSYLNYFKS